MSGEHCPEETGGVLETEGISRWENLVKRELEENSKVNLLRSTLNNKGVIGWFVVGDELQRHGYHLSTHRKLTVRVKMEAGIWM